jgi:hypothetical protein
VLTLVALFATNLPSFAWSCPMTGRIGDAVAVCQPARSHDAGSPKHNTPGVDRAVHMQRHSMPCCKSPMSLSRQDSGAIVQTVAKGHGRACCCKKEAGVPCARPGGKCCKPVQVPTSDEHNTAAVIPSQASSNGLALTQHKSFGAAHSLAALLPAVHTAAPLYSYLVSSPVPSGPEPRQPRLSPWTGRAPPSL